MLVNGSRIGRYQEGNLKRCDTVAAKRIESYSQAHNATPRARNVIAWDRVIKDFKRRRREDAIAWANGPGAEDRKCASAESAK